ncbi:mitogen-activated protein kinase kinase kinase 16 [Euphorbia peplus]|nr:mitogen-activated protein kinase kinase kinase 16 [Euphorbia peplus]
MDWKRGPIIGRGSTATVSLATSTSSGELFAVKSSELSTSTSLQKEEFFLSKLISPYVIKYIGHQITQENSHQIYNILLEYAPGGTLHNKIVSGGRLEETTIRQYTRNIIQGLNYLHTNGLAHCDIKSQNILMTKQGPKIADFGCATFVDHGPTNISGTPAFMSPEVARGEDQGFPADIWAMGCTIIEMATGKIPWTEYTNDPISALYKIGFSSEVPEFPTWLSGKGKDFLSKCLRRDPRERWTVQELLEHSFLDVEEISVTSFSPSCVLDQDFWEAMDGLESPNHDFRVQDSLDSPSERIKNLINGCGFESSLSWDEEWITVRSSSEIEEDQKSIEGEGEDEDEDEDEDGGSVPSGFMASDEQEVESSSSSDQEFLMDFIENEIRISENNIRISDIVSDNLNFETDHNDKILFSSISFCCFFFVLGLNAILIFWVKIPLFLFLSTSNHVMIYSFEKYIS